MIFDRFIDKNSDQRRRRWTVLAMYLFMALSLGMFIGFSTFENAAEGWRWLMLACSVIFFFPYYSAFQALRAATQGIANEQHPNLDERQQVTRNLAYYRAYTILSSVALFVLFYYGLALSGIRLPLWVPPAKSFLQAVFLPTFLLVNTLPTSIIAWNEPDLEEE